MGVDLYMSFQKYCFWLEKQESTYTRIDLYTRKYGNRVEAHAPLSPPPAPLLHSPWAMCSYVVVVVMNNACLCGMDTPYYFHRKKGQGGGIYICKLVITEGKENI